MSIRESAWVPGGPRSLKTEYFFAPAVLFCKTDSEPKWLRFFDPSQSRSPTGSNPAVLFCKTDLVRKWRRFSPRRRAGPRPAQTPPILFCKTDLAPKWLRFFARKPPAHGASTYPVPQRLQQITEYKAESGSNRPASPPPAAHKPESKPGSDWRARPKARSR